MSRISELTRLWDSDIITFEEYSKKMIEVLSGRVPNNPQPKRHVQLSFNFSE